MNLKLTICLFAFVLAGAVMYGQSSDFSGLASSALAHEGTFAVVLTHPLYFLGLTEKHPAVEDWTPGPMPLRPDLLDYSDERFKLPAWVAVIGIMAGIGGLVVGTGMLLWGDEYTWPGVALLAVSAGVIVLVIVL